MKHLKSVSSIFESVKDNNLQGFYFSSNMSATYIGAYPTFTEFANSIIEDIGIEAEDKILTWEDLDNEIMNTLDHEDSEDYQSNVWSGFIPKSTSPFFWGDWKRNPYVICDAMEERFINPGRIMKLRRSGNENELEYIIKSIYANISLIADYHINCDKRVKDYIKQNVDPEKIAESLNGDLGVLSNIYKYLSPVDLEIVLDTADISKEEFKSIVDVKGMGLI